MSDHTLTYSVSMTECVIRKSLLSSEQGLACLLTRRTQYGILWLVWLCVICVLEQRPRIEKRLLYLISWICHVISKSKSASRFALRCRGCVLEWRSEVLVSMPESQSKSLCAFRRLACVSVWRLRSRCCHRTEWLTRATKYFDCYARKEIATQPRAK